MRICDRCRKGHVMYTAYVGDGNKELCSKCYKDLEELHIVFGEMEKSFMKNKTLKHIDVDWS